MARNATNPRTRQPKKEKRPSALPVIRYWESRLALLTASHHGASRETLRELEYQTFKDFERLSAEQKFSSRKPERFLKHPPS